MNPTYKTLIIEGMSCGHCVRAVETSLKEVPGVKTVNVTVGRAEVQYDLATTSPTALVKAVEGAGYSVRPG